MTTTTFTPDELRTYRLLVLEHERLYQEHEWMQERLTYDRCVTEWLHRDHMRFFTHHEQRTNAAQDAVWSYEEQHPGIRKAAHR